MRAKANGLVSLTRFDGFWFFKEGNDTSWARKDINMTGWKASRPAELSAKYADKNGRVEGWFRAKIRLDNVYDTQRLGILYFSYGAVDIYIDGKPVASYGNTGANGKPYAETANQGTQIPGPVIMKEGVEYTIALHFVDYLSPFPPKHLKSNDANPDLTLCLTDAVVKKTLLPTLLRDHLYFNAWWWVCAVLTLLFWMLYIQNTSDKTLRLIAICATFFAVATGSILLQNTVNQSSTGNFIILGAMGLSLELIFVTVPLIIANIFKRRVSLVLKVFLILLIVFAFISVFLPATQLWLNIADAIPLITCIYYIVTSWKQLRGALWSVVVGLLVSLLSFLLLIATLYLFKSVSNETILYFNTALLLSFPISLLGYVATRFKEIIKEVQQNAAQVVRLSEEKKEEALNRQRLLQEEVDRQTAEIRANQTRLIQSEKMASLGELTAGIAHEIQNPLNFVNNFSEVSTELLEELKQEAKEGHTEDVIEIADSLSQNLEKITHHGKRADAIVKGMLQHSQTGSGAKELININTLADEYMRLSYHGLRAKDKSFNADLVTHYDEHLPKINAIPQDMGRVMLNLFNNAFYAVNQKQKTAVADYKPEITVTTSTQNSQVIIKVKDNGIGIPDSIKEKIMQPFFTTKPPGEGTGLGLSLTYDMVVKGHGGSINVNTKEGEFTEFIISLPIS
jgi:two-component system NtrC family sensor kinase